jgi:DNA (cytosine-5)-methyltransferase 1
LPGDSDEYNREEISIELYPEEIFVPPQVHVRLEDKVYESLSKVSAVAKKPIQDCAREAIIHYISREIPPAKTKASRFTFVDLFAGIGGMRLAFEANRGKCVYSSEWDKYCQQTYFANFNELPAGDITAIGADDIPDHDILTAGFPCQPFSIAGVSKKNSLGRKTGFLDKTQGTLFFDVARIIKAKRPKAFLLENVKNLKSHDKGNTWKVILATLDELKYEVFTDVLDGQNYTPQHRERALIVGFDRRRYGKDIPFSFPKKKPKVKPRISDILEDEVDDRYTLSDHLWKYLQDYAKKHQAKGNGFGYGMVDINGVARTLSARYYKDGSEILIPQDKKNPRRLTPRECARLQGFGNDFEIPVSDTQAYRQFGNSVVVPLITAVGKNIVKTLEILDER